MWLDSASGSDTLVIQFDSAVTYYQLSANPTGTLFAGGGGKGGTFALSGAYGLRLDLYNLNWTVPPGNQYPHCTDIRLSAPPLQEVQEIGDYEGIVNIAIGLDRDVCPTFASLADPPRLVVQFPAS